MEDCQHNYRPYYDLESDCKRCKACDTCMNKSEKEYCADE